MSFLTRVIRQSIPISSRYGGLCMYSTVTPTPKQDIEKLVSANKVVVFMKGNPDVSSHSIPTRNPLVYQIHSFQAPKCGFSNAVVQIMRMHSVPYDSYDILEDESLRQGKTELRTNFNSTKTVLFQESRISATGPPSHRSLLTANLWAAVTSCCRCTRTEN